MSANPAILKVAQGLHFARRQMVLNGLSSLTAQVYRRTEAKQPDTLNNEDDEITWGAIALQNQDAPEYGYQFLGYAGVILDNFKGGSVANSGNYILDNELTKLAQIEPFIETDSLLEKIRQIPKWSLQKGDILGVMLYDGFLIWYEIIDITGLTSVSDHAKKYVLNYRNEPELEPIQTELNARDMVE